MPSLSETGSVVVYGRENAFRLFSTLDNLGISATMETMGEGGIRYNIIATSSEERLRKVARLQLVSVEPKN